MALIIISLIFVAVPLSLAPDSLSGVLPITIGSVIFILIGEVLARRKKGN
jgi:hypothetical protein